MGMENRRLTLVAPLAPAGCYGDAGFRLTPPHHIGSPDDVFAGGKGKTEVPLDAAASPLRRLTPSYYRNSVRDLLGAPSATADIPNDVGTTISMLTADK